MTTFFKVKNYASILRAEYEKDLPMITIAAEFIQGILDRFKFSVPKAKAVRILWNIIEHYTFAVVRFKIDDTVEKKD